LIERGVGRGVLHDRSWAARLGAKSTGSAAAPMAFGDGGPMASALVVGAGTAASTEELLSGISRGLYVRRFHYVNGLLDPRRAVMTGLTRDGTFLVENGRVGRAVGNMRFTDSLLEAFERCDGATAQRWVRPNWWSDAGSVAAPAVRIRELRFTGGSQVLPRLDDAESAA
jgi:predicted Zn-dependent protease